MRDMTKVEKAWLLDLAGELRKEWLANRTCAGWDTILHTHEGMSGLKFEVRGYAASTMFYGMEYGYTVQVVGTYPRDCKTICEADRDISYRWR